MKKVKTLVLLAAMMIFSLTACDYIYNDDDAEEATEETSESVEEVIEETTESTEETMEEYTDTTDWDEEEEYTEETDE